jgi:hypothetical protein
MDELFGEAGFATADLSLKARIEREIGLTALLGGDETEQPYGLWAEKSRNPEDHTQEQVEKKELEE